MNERRYSDDEVAEIFRMAATAQPTRETAPAQRDGLTLNELQAIGREVGVEPERIAAAAQSLQRSGVPTRRASFRMPIGVGRVVDLPRALTDREWDLLVAELRQTFAAHGKELSTATVRSWRNGNLHAYVEPSANGYRLRIGTFKGNARAMNGMGVGLLITGGVLLIGASAPVLTAGLLAAGASMVGINVLRLPAWARERSDQMEHIANRALALASSPPTNS